MDMTTRGNKGKDLVQLKNSIQRKRSDEAKYNFFYNSIVRNFTTSVHINQLFICTEF